MKHWAAIAFSILAIAGVALAHADGIFNPTASNVGYNDFGNIDSNKAGGGSSLACTYSPVTTGTQNVAYTGATPSASGGVPSYTFSETGSLPTGLSINTSTGVISGTPSVFGSFSGIQVQVTDTHSTTVNCGASFTLVITAAFSITNTDFAADSTSQTTYTWSSRAFAIGAAASSRVVVVAVFARQAGTVGGASSVSIGGSAATLVVSAVNTTTPAATATSTMELYALAVPLGTTATVSVTYPSAMLRAGCAVFSVLGSNGAIPSGGAIALDQTSLLQSVTGTITVPVGGGAIVAAAMSGETGVTPTNYTQDVNAAVGSSWMAAGHDTSNSGSTTYIATGTGGTVNQPAGVFAAWHP